MPTSHVEWNLRRRFEEQLPARLQRLSELQYRRVIGAHFFAEASREFLELYRDGYMLGCIMCAQSLLEAMLKFVAKRNGLPFKKDVEVLIEDLQARAILSDTAIASAKIAWRHRNDFHHLNPQVQSVDVEAKAKECVEAVCFVEEDVFGGAFRDGGFMPSQPKYWDLHGDGMVTVFLRQLDV